MYKQARRGSWRGPSNNRNRQIRGARHGFSNKTNIKKGWNIQELLQVVEQSATITNPTNNEAPYVSSFKFSDLKIDPQIKSNIILRNYRQPTPIQDKAIPAVLSGLDVIGIANTGTGKTAAFLIPLIDKVVKNPDQRVLIITPTRELAFQINEEFLKFSRGLNVRSAICIGGGNMYGQKRQLNAHPEFVIGTPGRIKDFIQQGVLNLSNFNNVVLDETDRMVDIGFITEIKYFISLLPKTRQSLFFSATVTPKVEEIIRSFVTNPVTISVKKQETSENIQQNVIKVSGSQAKIDLLHDLLISEQIEKAVVFGKTKWGVQKLSNELIRRGFKAGAIHGDKRQNQRQATLNQFKKSEINILIATDVAARGLDIPNVSHVINYEIPQSYDDYVHRIGRTGRADKKGKALTFID